MKCPYPTGSEYEYLYWRIQEMYFIEQAELCNPIQDAGWKAYSSGDRDRSHVLWQELQRMGQKICEQRWRREDIRSEYPVKRYVQRIRELEAELNKLKGVEEKPQEPQLSNDDALF